MDARLISKLKKKKLKKGLKRKRPAAANDNAVELGAVRSTAGLTAAAAAAAASTSTSEAGKRKGNDKETHKKMPPDEVESPPSLATWESLGVCDVLCKSCRSLGWEAPSAIQAESIPVALGGSDIIGLAETGSGKTGAFALPVLQWLLSNPRRLSCLVLAPTRELAFQIGEQFTALGASIGVQCAVIVGGVDIMQQSIALARKPHVIVATPGRMIDHLENTKGFTLSSIRHLIMDEADRMLSMDFEEEINRILQVLPGSAQGRRTSLFSATMTSKVAKLQRASLHKPVRCEVSSSKYQTVKTLVQQYLFIPAKHKDVYFAFVLNEFAGKTAIVFVSTCATARRATYLLRNLGFGATCLHGQMSQPKRLGALNKFKAGEREILIATDVASRGLDIPAVDLVVNFDVPQNAKDYVHRVGRTARAGRAGRAVTFVTQYDVQMYQRIEKLIEKKLGAFPTEKEEVMVLHERVAEAQRHAAMQVRDEDESSGKRGGKKGKRQRR